MLADRFLPFQDEEAVAAVVVAIAGSVLVVVVVTGAGDKGDLPRSSFFP